MNETDVMNDIVERIIIERNKKVDTLILGEIKKIATENGVDTKIILNEKAIVSALRKRMPEKVTKFLPLHKAICPICKVTIQAHASNKYCNYCGQALDWRDEE